MKSESEISQKVTLNDIGTDCHIYRICLPREKYKKHGSRKTVRNQCAFMLVIFKNLKVIFKINGEVLVNYINELDTVLLNRYIAEQVLNLYVLND